jgi:hypothetical protein
MCATLYIVKSAGLIFRVPDGREGGHLKRSFYCQCPLLVALNGPVFEHRDVRF